LNDLNSNNSNNSTLTWTWFPGSKMVVQKVLGLGSK